jgi:hypothetical protein
MVNQNCILLWELILYYAGIVDDMLAGSFRLAIRNDSSAILRSGKGPETTFVSSKKTVHNFTLRALRFGLRNIPPPPTFDIVRMKSINDMDVVSRVSDRRKIR